MVWLNICPEQVVEIVCQHEQDCREWNDPEKNSPEFCEVIRPLCVLDGKE